MEKIDQIEKLKNVQAKVAQNFGMQRLLEPIEFSESEMESRCKHQLFDALKQEISSHLSALDALFNASVVLEDDGLLVRLFRCMNGFCGSLQDTINYLSSYNEDDEEGGDDEIS